jgi:hypothetical protein
MPVDSRYENEKELEVASQCGKYQVVGGAKLIFFG